MKSSLVREEASERTRWFAHRLNAYVVRISWLFTGRTVTHLETAATPCNTPYSAAATEIYTASVRDQIEIGLRCGHQHDFVAVHYELDPLGHVFLLPDHELGELVLDVPKYPCGRTFVPEQVSADLCVEQPKATRPGTARARKVLPQL